MLSPFPAPVLSLTADAVRGLDGSDALSGLWTLFSKCKESLQDGRRLENISWRLWHRELAASHSYRPLTPESVSTSDHSRPISPFFVNYDHQKPCHRSTTPPPKTLHSSDLPSPHNTPSIGNTICYILPRLIRFPMDKSPLPTPNPDFFISPHGSSLPTPAADADIISSRTLDLPIAIPSVQLPSTPPEHASLFPRVVVVNPTPNLTPHPTPPASPIFTSNIPSPPTQSSHLLPPLPAPTLTIPPTLPTIIPSKPPPPSNMQQVLPRSPLSPQLPNLIDETLKPSDRRFFLQQSPDGESPERSEGHKSLSDQASSATTSSSPRKLDVDVMAHPQTATTTAPTRKGKESTRHAPTRHVRHRPAVIRRAATIDGSKVRPTFNIGSTSSNGSGPKRDGSKGDGSKRNPVPAPKTATKVPKPPPAPKPLVASPPKTANPPQRRRIVVASTSSEYETTDTEDGDSWASEEPSAEDVEKRNEEVRLREAAVEAQRQREMFAKVPKRSYSNLNRTQSGLLSQLLNPDPTLFPSNHPYRTSFSSQGFSQLPHSSIYAPRRLHTSKSVAALPLAAQVTADAQAPSAGLGSTSTRTAVGPGSASGGSGGYRPKGRPLGQEMEDESSGDENPDDTIQVSRSVAQEKLAALAGRRRASPPAAAPPPPVRPPLTSSATSPIPLRHPYNLPAPAAPSTPRTTRRQMLQTELSESLRRNLLWERQMSKATNGNARRHSSGLAGLGGLRPLTSTATVVQVTVRREAGGSRSGGEGGPVVEAGGERKMGRNRSWADDYHYSGW